VIIGVTVSVLAIATTRPAWPTTPRRKPAGPREGISALSIHHLRPSAAVLGLDSLTNRQPDRRAAAIDADTGSGMPQSDPDKLAQTAHPLMAERTSESLGSTPPGWTVGATACFVTKCSTEHVVRQLCLLC
jgi:hypothetical protein